MERNRIPAGLAFLVVLLLGPALEPSQDIEPPPSEARPLLKLDLRKFGYKSRGSWKPDYLSVDFADANQLVFGWTILDDPTLDKKVGPLTATPSHLHLLVLDARTGQKQTSAQWPSISFRGTVHPVTKARFLCCTGNTIRLLSEKFDVIREKEVPDSFSCSRIQISPSRRAFSIEAGAGVKYHGTLLETDSFSPVTDWKDEAANVHIADDFLAGTCSPNFELCLRRVNQTWEPLAFAGVDQIKDQKNISPVFINDSSLLILAGEKSTVVTVEGYIRLRINVPDKYLVGRTVTSSGNDRFALVEGKLRGIKSDFLDLYPFFSEERVVVFGLAEGKTIYVRKVQGTSPWPPFETHINHISLSPDGALLAVVDDGTLSVYQLSATNP